MIKNKDITPINNNNQRHGYWELYNTNGSLFYRGLFVNGKQRGLWKWYYEDGSLILKVYYNNNGHNTGVSILN